MNRFWGLKLAVMQAAPTQAVQPVGTPTVPKDQRVPTTVLPNSPKGNEIMPPPPVRQHQPAQQQMMAVASADYYKGFRSKTAAMMTDENKELLGGILGGIGGLGTSSLLVERMGQTMQPFKGYGGYGPTLSRLLTGHGIKIPSVKGVVGKGMAGRVLLALLMGTPYLAGTGLGMTLGDRVARTFEEPAKPEPI